MGIALSQAPMWKEIGFELTDPLKIPGVLFLLLWVLIHSGKLRLPYCMARTKNALFSP